MPTPIDIWTVRHAIYQFFAEHARAPRLEEIASQFQLRMEEAQAAFTALDEVHALFLDPGTWDIHIANPFSGVPTDFLVTVAGKTYYANCAWDAFGVIAALQAEAGEIQAACTQDGAPLRLAVRDGEAVSQGEVIHFLVPFSQWYDDMVFT